MPKKVSSKSPPTTQEEPASEQKKPKKQGNEIDEIFSNKKKRKKSEQKQVDDKPKEDVNPRLKKMKKVKVFRTDRLVDPPLKPRKRTGDGFVIYTEEELGIGKADAGDTPLCPFDCSCCF